ncbi:lipolytic enzyme, G-D-S-L [Rhodobacterales bacterium HKCCE3408]|nr:lipolytic enzyme, G-D-S-L [Rhodobacterales bacterium HKCCE3408]
MKTWLAFGDSNTHGTAPHADPSVIERFGPDIRWPAVAAARLGPDWHLVEEGLPGRTTSIPDPLMGAHMDGRTGLKIALMTHGQIDAISIMLGTNDVKVRFGATPQTIAAGIAGLLDIVRSPEMVARSGNPKVLLIAPPPVREVGVRAPEWLGATEKSAALPAAYARIAAAYGAAFLDAGAHVAVAADEGIHWPADAHRAFGAVAADAIAGLF